MKAELIAVGTEILTGQIVNTNAQYLSEKFAEWGIDVFFQTAVGDNEKRLLSVLEQAKQRSDLVVLCGGLGPTDDDLTKQTLAIFLERRLVFDDLACQKLDKFFQNRPTSSRTPNNERQAQIIEGAIPLQNPTGLAVGSMLTVDGVCYVLLPGPPRELKAMVNESLEPLLNQEKERLYSRVLRFFGIGESRLVTILSDMIRNQTDPTLAPYAKTGEVTLRLSTKASNSELAKRKLDAYEEAVLSHEDLREYCYGYGEENSLPQVVVSELKKQRKSLSVAESLTAGLFQARLSEFPGVSEIYKGGFVTYSIDEKSKMLHIPMADLEEHGVISSFTAEKMAEQARYLTDTDMAISLTGVAGPESLEDNPVGTVFIGLATREVVTSFEVSIGLRSRQDVREIAVLHAFNFIRKALLNHKNQV